MTTEIPIGDGWGKAISTTPDTFTVRDMPAGYVFYGYEEEVPGSVRVRVYSAGNLVTEFLGTPASPGVYGTNRGGGNVLHPGGDFSIVVTDDTGVVIDGRSLLYGVGWWHKDLDQTPGRVTVSEGTWIRSMIFRLEPDGQGFLPSDYRSPGKYYNTEITTYSLPGDDTQMYRVDSVTKTLFTPWPNGLNEAQTTDTYTNNPWGWEYAIHQFQELIAPDWTPGPMHPGGGLIYLHGNDLQERRGAYTAYNAIPLLTGELRVWTGSEWDGIGLQGDTSSPSLMKLLTERGWEYDTETQAFGYSSGRDSYFDPPHSIHPLRLRLALGWRNVAWFVESPDDNGGNWW